MDQVLDCIDPQALRSLCQHYHIECLELFGSRARNDARPDSDVDVMVTFAPGHTPGIAFFQLALDLEDLFKLPVDLVTRHSVENAVNEFKKRSMLAHTKELYHAA